MASGSAKQFGGRSKGVENWTDAETVALINIWGEEDMQAHFACVHFTNVQVFRKIVERLRKDYGVDRSGQACQNRIRKLKNYKKVKDNNNRSGRGHKTCKHFDELDKILGNRPLQMLRNLLDTSTSTQATDENSQDDIFEDGDENIDEEEELDDAVEPLGSPSERQRSASFSSTSSADSFIPLRRGGTVTSYLLRNTSPAAILKGKNDGE
ncbi:uncharacterized protein LOC106177834 isoform X1 [Lingula anatina]|uniref:Uncharacterized protein LOC106177834 isoform X1 n=1 Tax=Lingula anatina TaxID=7574 RepID=A0A1S3K0Y7_LINAN|nr:uncharacterized protein LOC106177834 isoform X1 [Lingula anatina]|eukprot:XP_013416192.1 uncharacterized protein LOC106177834 isoform X1 [Lingula anatina]